MSESKIPMPPVKQELFMPVSFWAELLSILDRKIQIMHDGEGFGQIAFKIVMQNKKITHVKFNDEISVKNLQDIANKYLDIESNHS